MKKKTYRKEAAHHLPGKPRNSTRKNRGYLLYLGITALILITPLVGMTVRPTNETSENKELSKLPAIYDKKGWNQSFLSDLGNYFEEHFAFRQELVTANSLLRSKLVKTSAEKKVALGRDGWLYYSGTSDDYQGVNLLSERSLYNIAHTLSMVQGMTEALGSEFYYTVSPNKNSLYDENMPYYYKKGVKSNLDRLTPYLEEEGVHYVDLKSAFLEEDEVLYLKRDSHWNNKGAVLAYNTILDAAGKEHESYLNIPYIEEKDYLGDLNKMLYPLAAKPEINYTYQRDETYEYISDEKDVEAEWIEAENSQRSGSVLMYRDSFGNTLFPLFANEFAKTYFSKLVPYNLGDVAQYRPDYVIIERVERRISSIIEKPPIMQGPVVKLPQSQSADTQTTVHTRKNGSYFMIEGIIDSRYLETKSRIFITISPNGQNTGTTYEAFGMLAETEEGKESDCGYQLYLMEKNVPQDADFDIEVIVSGEKGTYTVQKMTYTKK